VKSNEHENPQRRNSDDPALSRTLKSWKIDSSLPPRFEERVWSRIANREAEAIMVTPWTALRLWLRQMALKPAFAVSYAAVLLVAGLAGGLWQSRLAEQRTEQTMGTRYVQMVDPYQMPRH